MQRRHFITSIIAGAGAVALSTYLYKKTDGSTKAYAAKGTFNVQKTDKEWQNILEPAAYAVLRRHSTERPFTSPLLKEARNGIYHCKGCDHPLYDSKTKYDSKTGWPSFYDALPNAVGTKKDFKLVIPRTEVHCANCGGHLGHIFDDGPRPTGKRHCINGVALTFKPANI